MADKKENLHELAERFDQLNKRFIELGGEVNEYTAPLLAELEATEADFHAKVDRLRFLIAHNKSEARFYREESQRYAARGKAFARVAEHWEEWILLSMERAGLDEAGHLIPQRIQLSSRPTFDWVAVGKMIPRAFRKTVVSLDLSKAYAAWKENRLPKGIEAKRGRHLRDVNTFRKEVGGGEDDVPTGE